MVWEDDAYIIETYQKAEKPLVHVLAKGMRHEDEKKVFALAWERMFSQVIREEEGENVQKDRI
ncbi:MAG: hypothetical protein HFG41_05645 [Coprococcus sp.]|nr:hypothetical protein [Coprococcus sp.]